MEADVDDDEKMPHFPTMASSSSTMLRHGGIVAPCAAMPPNSTSTSSSSPCAACKFLRRKCQPDCIFAPYFPPDNPGKFIMVHKVFGASNVTKLLKAISPLEREDAVTSLAYEAEWRLKEPIYGCVSVISSLQCSLRQVQIDLAYARAELNKYMPALQSPASGNGFININLHLASGLDCDQLFQMQQQQQLQQQQQQMMMMRGYNDSELAAKLGNNAGYEDAVVPNVNASAIGYINAEQFLKPDPVGSTEQQSIRPV